MSTISAVIPVHNRFDLLHETLRSVFSQTRPVDEVVLVDDCSSLPLKAHFASHPPPGPVKIVRTDRARKVSGARNLGWRESSGDLIAFNDSDDLWEPEKTQIQAEYLEAHPEVDGVYGPMVAFFPDGRVEPWAHDRPPRVDAATALIDANLTVQTLMIRRVALEKLGGFDEKFGILDDQAMAIEIGLAGLHVVFLDSAPLTRLRRNDRNFSQQARRYFLEDCMIALRYRKISGRIYGRGSFLVHLGRAIERFGRKKRFLGRPSGLLGQMLRACTPGSRMPGLGMSGRS